jgi:hypothetical protein
MDEIGETVRCVELRFDAVKNFVNNLKNNLKYPMEIFRSEPKYCGITYRVYKELCVEMDVCIYCRNS